MKETYRNGERLVRVAQSWEWDGIINPRAELQSGLGRLAVGILPSQLNWKLFAALKNGNKGQLLICSRSRGYKSRDKFFQSNLNRELVSIHVIGARKEGNVKFATRSGHECDAIWFH